MLHHEDSLQPAASGSAAPPAAQVRVTAEELARAVARYQARRDEAAQRLEGTLTLGEAVQELHLDMTPEELLAEVQAERRAEKPLPKANNSRRSVLAGFLALLIFSSGLMLALNSGPHPPPMPPPISCPWRASLRYAASATRWEHGINREYLRRLSAL